MSAHTDNERSEAAVDVPRLIRRLRLQPEDIGGPSMMEMLRERREAADALEALLEERAGWRCKAGGEVFVTYDKTVAEEWERDGIDVEKFFAPNDPADS